MSRDAFVAFIEFKTRADCTTSSVTPVRHTTGSSSSVVITENTDSGQSVH